MSNTLQILIAMMIYMSAVILIGLFFARRANRSSKEYFIGGRDSFCLFVVRLSGGFLWIWLDTEDRRRVGS